ncbi:MAG: acetamidase/formamidase family protein [Clostridia bacterium]
MDFHLDKERFHRAWDRTIPPALQVPSGTTIQLDTNDASGGQLSRTSTSRDLVHLDFAGVNPVTGPILVDGAEPGDVIRVTIIDIEVGGWGWTANIPGFGLLADKFPDPHLVLAHRAGSFIIMDTGVRLPTSPFVGTIGLAPAEPGPHALIPPRRVGGNLDTRFVAPGARLYLPVEVAGGLLSVGDCHACQGDGEVCGTAVEVAASVTLRVDLVKDRSLKFPMLETHPVSDRRGPAIVTMGVGPDLMTAARDATEGMIEEIGRRTRLSPVDAYLLCSVAGDLKIQEVVDAPNWVVAMHLEAALLDF